MKKILNIVTKKAFISSVLFLIEILTLAIFMIALEKNFIVFWFVIYVLNIVTAFAIANSKLNNAFKISWIISLILLPGVGTILFFVFGKKQATKKMKKIFQHTTQQKPINLQENFKNSNIEYSYLQMMQWILNVSGQPTYCDTSTEFFNSGETFFNSLIYDLKAAKKSIFLEFFIICPGHMWNKIVEILLEKAKLGLDVRLIYDDFGTFASLPKNYDKQLNKLKIKTKVFNKIKLRIDSFMNNRDHRKIVVIDNKIGYTGGINIADEYVNKIKRFGHWQDSAIKITGPATQSLTNMFLNMWHYLTQKNKIFNSPQPKIISLEKGLVMPFSDNPVNENRLNHAIYLKIINCAKKYVYIQTPYLILDEILTNALINCAQSGVKVIIITPHIFDKFYVHTITQKTYENLIKSGVKVFEYTPGFMHSKIIVADDNVAVIGTANFDYRSLYMQFENSVWIYKTKSLKQIIENFENILKQCKEIKLNFYDKKSITRKLLNIFLKPFITFL